MIDEVLKVFKKTLDEWGRQTGFIRRKKIISAIDFLCRFFVGTALLDPVTLVPVDLLGILTKMKGDSHQMKVLMGSQGRGLQVICRLVCLRVPQEVANERRRKLRKAMLRKKKQEPSKYYLQMADWTLMVTNAPEAWLPLEMVRPLYSLRWQIELLFNTYGLIPPLKLRGGNVGLCYTAHH